MKILDRLLGHDAWTTWTLLTLSQQQLDQEFDLGWRTVRATLEHIVGSMETWTDLMEGVPPRPWPEADGSPTLDALEGRLLTVAPRLATLARRVEAAGQLDATFTDVLDTPPRQKPYGGAIVHVVTHSMHYRAQLIHMLKRLGVPDVPEGDALGWERRGAPTIPPPTLTAPA